MLWQMVLIENQKLNKRLMYKIAVGSMILVTLIMYGGLYWLSNTSGFDNGSLRIDGDFAPGELDTLLTWPEGLALGYQAAMALGSLLLIILVGTTTAQDYQWRSFQTWLSRGVSRWMVLLGKFGAAVLAALALALTAVFFSFLMTGWLSQVTTDTVPFATINWGSLLLNLLLSAYAILPYAALTLLIATLTRSTGATLGITIALQQLGESLIQTGASLLGGNWANLIPYLPGNLIAAVGAFQQGTETADLGANMLSIQMAVWVIALYILVFVGAALFQFQRQDLGG
ncbi:MAG: hypothetical protein AAF614_19335 [Chloroflexota bacterium]